MQKCEICSRRFKNKQALGGHLSHPHPKEATDVVITPSPADQGSAPGLAGTNPAAAELATSASSEAKASPGAQAATSEELREVSTEEKVKGAALAIFEDLEMSASVMVEHTLRRTLQATDLPALEGMVVALGQRLGEVCQTAQQVLRLSAGPEAEVLKQKVKEAAQDWQLIPRLEALHSFQERHRGVFTNDEGKATAASLMAVAMIGFRGQIGEAGVEKAKLLGLKGDDAARTIRRLSRVLLSGKTGLLEAAWRGRESQERAFQSPCNSGALGYRWDGKVYLPDEHYPIACDIWHLALNAAKLTVRGIAGELTRRGIPTLRHKRVWNPSSIDYLLHNPIYAGRIAALRHEAVEPGERRATQSGKPTYGKSSCRLRPEEEWEWLEGLVAQPVVTWEEFQWVQQRLELNGQYAKREGRGYLLRGIIECQLCHRRYIGKSWDSYWNYCCRGKSGIPWGAEKCPSRDLNGCKVEDNVWHKVTAYLLTPEVYIKELEVRARNIPRSPWDAPLLNLGSGLRRTSMPSRRLSGRGLGARWRKRCMSEKWP